MTYWDDDPWSAFTPDVADVLRSAFQAEVDRRMRPSEEAAEDEAFAAEEARLARIYPGYASQRVAILEFAIANGIENVQQAYEDFTLASQEARMREQYGDAYDRNRLAILQHAIKNETDIESAFHDVRDSSAMDARAQHRATRLEELEHKFSPADELEKQALRQEKFEDGEKVFEKTLKQKHREETRLASIDNSLRDATIRNDRRSERARAGRVDVDQPKFLDRERLDREATAMVERANVDDLNDRADSTGLSGGLGSHPEVGL